MDNKENIWKIICIILSVIIVGLVIYIFIGRNNNVNEIKVETKESSIQSEDSFRMIRIDEDLSLEGTVEGLENVRWNDARITQYDDKMEVSIILNNESEKDKVEAKALDVILLDKDGNEIAKKETKMEEIDANYGYTTIDLDFEITDITIIYDIKIIVK